MKAKLSLLVASVAALSAPLHSQVAFDGDYSQDFDSLASSGTGNTWTDNSTLEGWYASRITYNAGTGSGTTGALYSFGSSNGSDRALGSLASDTTGTIAFGVRLLNTSGLSLENIFVSFDGEQWRNGANTTQHSLSFWYRIGLDLIDVSPGSDAGWTSVSSLEFLGPVANATGAALDGNDTANRAELGAALEGVSLAPGQELFLRWKDINNVGSDHGLAIDNFNVTALTVVPETSTWALLGGGLAFLAYRLRRRK